MQKVITFGEIMLRLATPNHNRFIQSNFLNATFGGGEANVSVSLANYGINTEFVTCLPDNELGKWCLSELKKYNVGTNHIIMSNSGRIGIYFLETGAVFRPSKVIYDREFSSFSKIRPKMITWQKIFQNSNWFHWTGITPSISQEAAESCLEAIQVAEKLGLMISCDLNYRKNLWKWGKTASEIMPKLVSKCDIIVGNEEDAEKVFGIRPKNFDVTHTCGSIDVIGFESVCQELQTQFPKAKKIIITLRGSINANHNTWRSCLFSNSKLYQSKSYDITHIVDRVGSGDSFMGGLIYGLISYPKNCQKALDFAVSASALKHTISGDFNLVNAVEVEQLLNGDGSGRVLR